MCFLVLWTWEILTYLFPFILCIIICVLLAIWKYRISVRIKDIDKKNSKASGISNTNILGCTSKDDGFHDNSVDNGSIRKRCQPSQQTNIPSLSKKKFTSIKKKDLDDYDENESINDRNMSAPSNLERNTSNLVEKFSDPEDTTISEISDNKNCTIAKGNIHMHGYSRDSEILNRNNSEFNSENENLNNDCASPKRINTDKKSSPAENKIVWKMSNNTGSIISGGDITMPYQHIHGTINKENAILQQEKDELDRVIKDQTQEIINLTKVKEELKREIDNLIKKKEELTTDNNNLANENRLLIQEREPHAMAAHMEVGPSLDFP